jgi:hypothetical protein
LKNIEEARPFDELTVVCITGMMWLGKYGTNGCLFLGRSCCCSASHRREDISTRFQGALVGARLQGMAQVFAFYQSDQANYLIGEIRRPLNTVDNHVAPFLLLPVLL